MYGVVLWSNSDNTKAVIWCEDHGDLAFYAEDRESAQAVLDAGDLVQFDMRVDENMRYVKNPQLVREGVCDGLPDALHQKTTTAGGSGGQGAPMGHDHIPATAQILPFDLMRSRRNGQPGKGRPAVAVQI
ncbi:MAG: hypothetical protein OIF47_05740 [Marinibacterium sp.]|nr:hypothetical protein [Marinibacterium sp.]